jgi:hypothetical protein
LDVAVVENLLCHATNVELVRLKLPGKNSLDFALAYYIGRAVAADPTGYFHIVSKDKGFDPLVEHLRSKHIRIRRHNDFAALTFAASVKPKTDAPQPSPLVSSKPNPTSKSKPQTPTVTKPGDWGKQVLEQLHKPAGKRP